MVDFQAALDRKYNILQQEANARSAQAQGEAALYNARAQNVPTEGAVNLAQALKTRTEAQLAPMAAEAQAGYYHGLGEQSQAQAGLLGAQTADAYHRLAPATAGRKALLAGYYDQYNTTQTGGAPVAGLPNAGPSPFHDVVQPAGSLYATSDGGYAPIGGQTQYRPPAGSSPAISPAATASSAPRAGGGLPSSSLTSGEVSMPVVEPRVADMPSGSLMPGGVGIPAGGGERFDDRKKGLGVSGEFVNTTPGYATGTSRVPGKGAPNVDSVKADLAPDEAVLNAGAAEHLGRHTIDLLNALGAHKMALAGMAPKAKGAPDPKGRKGFAKGTSRVAC